jgi:hypothetical protein
MDLRSRIRELEDASFVHKCGDVFAETVALNVALIERRGIPLPPYPPDLDVRATAELWARDDRARERFVLIDGGQMTSEELWLKHEPQMWRRYNPGPPSRAAGDGPRLWAAARTL